MNVIHSKNVSCAQNYISMFLFQYAAYLLITLPLHPPNISFSCGIHFVSFNFTNLLLKKWTRFVVSSWDVILLSSWFRNLMYLLLVCKKYTQVILNKILYIARIQFVGIVFSVFIICSIAVIKHSLRSENSSRNWSGCSLYWLIKLSFFITLLQRCS